MEQYRTLRIAQSAESKAAEKKHQTQVKGSLVHTLVFTQALGFNLLIVIEFMLPVNKLAQVLLLQRIHSALRRQASQKSNGFRRNRLDHRAITNGGKEPRVYACNAHNRNSQPSHISKVESGSQAPVSGLGEAANVLAVVQVHSINFRDRWWIVRPDGSCWHASAKDNIHDQSMVFRVLQGLLSLVDAHLVLVLLRWVTLTCPNLRREQKSTSGDVRVSAQAEPRISAHGR